MTSHHKRSCCMNKWVHPVTLLVKMILKIQHMPQVIKSSWASILRMKAASNDQDSINISCTYVATFAYHNFVTTIIMFSLQLCI